jgi:hypothetical protein
MTDNDDSSIEETPTTPSSSSSSKMATLLKSAAACALLYSAVSTLTSHDGAPPRQRRQLSMVGDSVPSYMDPLMQDLRERKKLFDDTPPEEVKYWFEYSGPLQVSCVETVALSGGGAVASIALHCS